MSKVFFISIVKREAFRPEAKASSTSWVKHVVRFTDDYKGRALNCWLFVTFKLIASQDIFRASSLSSPLSSIERRVIGR